MPFNHIVRSVRTSKSKNVLYIEMHAHKMDIITSRENIHILKCASCIESVASEWWRSVCAQWMREHASRTTRKLILMRKTATALIVALYLTGYVRGAAKFGASSPSDTTHRHIIPILNRRRK